MNTTEKRKLETIIVSRLKSVRTAYRSRRSAEQKEVAERIKSNPPKEVSAMLSRYNDLHVEMRKINESLRKLGFQTEQPYGSKRYKLDLRSTTTYYIDGKYDSDGFTTYFHPELTAYDEHTKSTLADIEALEQAYTLELYGGSVVMNELLEKLAKEVEKLTA
tara:strand:+ start:394 stop:879 length:486 start_codon:yes stop_codon:yes gene_type:complete